MVARSAHEFVCRHPLQFSQRLPLGAIVAYCAPLLADGGHDPAQRVLVHREINQSNNDEAFEKKNQCPLLAPLG